MSVTDDAVNCELTPSAGKSITGRDYLMKPLLTLWLLAVSMAAAGFRIGVARANITPKTPIWLSGFLSRDRPFEGVVHDLWAKALAIEDPDGQRVVIVTTDLIGFPRAISDEIAAPVQREHRLERAALLLNSSHTCPYGTGGPKKWRPNRRNLIDDVVSLVRAALRRRVEFANRLLCLLLLVAGVVSFADGASSRTFRVPLRTRTEVFKGSRIWEEVSYKKDLAINETAILICDMWDKHWCSGAEKRVKGLAPSIAATIKVAQARGILIIHSPSGTMSFYKKYPQRQRMLNVVTAGRKIPISPE